MNTTRANSAAAKAESRTAEPQTDSEEPLAAAPPLLMRFMPDLRFADDELTALQPKLGASVVVGDGYTGRNERSTKTVWLPAAAWQGMATIIRQTPDWWRHDVAAFLEVLHGSFGGNDPLRGLLAEVIDEVRRDPYTDISEDDRDAFDFVW
jgi:hypothetical protein